MASPSDTRATPLTPEMVARRAVPWPVPGCDRSFRTEMLASTHLNSHSVAERADHAVESPPKQWRNRSFQAAQRMSCQPPTNETRTSGQLSACPNRKNVSVVRMSGCIRSDTRYERHRLAVYHVRHSLERKQKNCTLLPKNTSPTCVAKKV